MNFDIDRLERICKTNGITLSGLEHKLGFGNGTIKKWGVSTPRLDKVQLVAEFFKMTVSELIGETKKATTLSRDEAELLSLFRMANQDGQMSIIGAVRVLSAAYLKNNPLSEDAI